MKRTRALVLALPLALTAALAMTGCSLGSDTNGGAAGADCVAAGDASKALKIEGEFGGEITLASETPVTATELQRSVLIEGDGDALADGDVVDATFNIFSGADGTLLSSEEAQVVNSTDMLMPWALDVLACSSIGDRVAAVAPVADILDAAVAESFSLDQSSSLVLVFDLLGVDKGCEATLPRDMNYPEVDLGDGATEPLITIPECMEAPTELEIDVLVEGNGPVVEADQKVMTNYVGVDWNGAERFDGNWSETGIEFSTAQGALIEGFTQAMIGQKVGSVILVTMPPELGYNDGMTRTFVLELVSLVS
ncbi:MAG: hypothetical protein GX814_03430 [Microbacteriaceae bacterium]|nr:hypothetical protein [Microbacteriaceae bacterium]